MPTESQTPETVIASTATESTAAAVNPDSSVVDPSWKAIDELDKGGAEAATEETQKEGESEPEKKPTKTPEQRELEQARRRIDKLTKRLHERDAVENYRASKESVHNGANDDEQVTLSRAELQEQIQQEARKLAPTMKQQQAVIEQRQAVVAALDKEFGTARFNEIAEDLDSALGGLSDRNGVPKPATDAIFEAENPKALVEYLADPDNEEEAEALGRMTATQAARAIVKLELKLAAKPQPSKATEPIAAVKAAATGKKSIFDMSDAEFFKARRNHGKR